MPDPKEDIIDMRVCSLKSILLVSIVRWIIVNESIIIINPKALMILVSCDSLKKLLISGAVKNKIK